MGNVVTKNTYEDLRRQRTLVNVTLTHKTKTNHSLTRSKINPYSNSKISSPLSMAFQCCPETLPYVLNPCGKTAVPEYIATTLAQIILIVIYSCEIHNAINGEFPLGRSV